MKKIAALVMFFIGVSVCHSGAEDEPPAAVLAPAERFVESGPKNAAELIPRNAPQDSAKKSSQVPPDKSKERGALTITLGDRSDNLDWNIAGNLSGTNPNVLSELEWKDLSIFQIKAAGNGTIKDVFFLRGAFDMGFIYDGENRDSDYSCDDRRCEYSRSNNKADSGSVWDVTLGGGFKNTVGVKGGVFAFTPLIGYSQHNQNLKITEGYQTIPNTGAFGGLNSSYKARWRGPWAGLDLGYNRNAFSLTGTFEYHVVSYHAEADWNLRTDFAHPKSFEHTANGTGYIAALGADYRLRRNWGVYAGLDYLRFKTVHGTDRTYFSDGTIADTRLNEVNWSSRSFNAGFRRRF